MVYKPRCGYGINDIKDNRNNFQQEYNWASKWSCISYMNRRSII
jgi:hypothetical protein